MNKKEFMMLAIFIFFFTILFFVSGKIDSTNLTCKSEDLGNCGCTNSNGETFETETSKAMCCILDKTDWSCTWNGENPCE